MSSDLVKRLRAPAYWMSGSSEGHEGENDAPREAADRIEALEGEVKGFRNEIFDAVKHARKLETELKAAEARAERLRVALAEIRDADANLGPMYDWADEKFQAVKAIAREALEKEGSE
jgi:septal ring factor EnvC (AmiA/AmiB activator)